MTTQLPVSMRIEAPSHARLDAATLYRDGIVAGVLGALTIALWFLLVLFRRGASLEALETVPVSVEMVLMFTWVHILVFVGLGGIVARAAAMAGYFRWRHPHLRVSP